MSKGDAPEGDLYAVIPQGREAKDRWVQLGPAWRNKDGGWTCVVEALPVAWEDPRCPKKLIVQPRGR